MAQQEFLTEPKTLYLKDHPGPSNAALRGYLVAVRFGLPFFYYPFGGCWYRRVDNTVTIANAWEVDLWRVLEREAAEKEWAELADLQKAAGAGKTG